ncbi:WD40 repeat domain-containing protein [Saccharothrix variisporea]|uniref:WD40 repeat protein n=1 Tax=Saccharothrix variisporea TaxID=543527 RepID=A0A495X3N6_9PSEU|nr:hypothetical protein [Saccharothrix variisporea]RKT68146.1 hypothetical protein DFJ66_1327 [Saccharothrix variisporea]
MDLLPCGHAARVGRSKLCEHLLVEEPPEIHRRLTGVGTEYDLVCAACAEARDLVVACEGCVERAEEEFTASPLPWLGEPGIRHLDGEAGGTRDEREWRVVPLGDRCLAPLPDGWLVLTADGLVAWGEDGSRLVGAVDVPADDTDRKPYKQRRAAVHTSPDGRFAAVVTDYGQYGTVVDLRDGSPVLALDRGGYHVDTTPFPVAFVGSTVIAATAWNRLDAFDAATGRLLTGRDLSQRYSGYFHGALHPSPDGRWLVCDSWVWSPAGTPHVVDLDAWLHGGRPFAPEDGRKLSQRWYAWDQPIAWVDERTIAIQRIGHDDEAMLPGVELYTVPEHRLKGLLAGPDGPMWAHGGLLYVATEAGLEVWDPGQGARTAVVEGFRPQAHNPATGAFARLSGGRLTTWTPTGWGRMPA